MSLDNYIVEEDTCFQDIGVLKLADITGSCWYIFDPNQGVMIVDESMFTGYNSGNCIADLDHVCNQIGRMLVAALHIRLIKPHRRP